MSCKRAGAMFFRLLPRPLGFAAATGFAALGFSSAAQAASIVYDDFSDVSGLQLNGSAHQSGNVLRLTDSYSEGGSAFSLNSITLGAEVSFSNYFAFSITNSAGLGGGADGLTFVVQTVANNVGSIGGGIGYSGIQKSVAVEFDTFDNGAADGNNGNHVGIDVNGSLNSIARVNYATDFNNGAIWHVWTDYNGATDLLEVRVADTDLRPEPALLSTTVNLVSILETTNAYVGFTSGTGAGMGYHDILKWEFRDAYSPVGVPDTGGTLALASAGLLLVAGVRRCRARR